MKRRRAFVFNTLLAMPLALGFEPLMMTPSPEKLELFEREARWRLGDWWDKTWCFIDPATLASSADDGRPELPDTSAVMLRNGTTVLSPHVLADPRWQNRPQALSDHLAATYRPWAHYEDVEGLPELEAVALATIDTAKASPAVPLLTQCRLTEAAEAEGLVLWPGLRQATDKVQEAMREVQVADVSWDRKHPAAVWRGRAPTGLDDSEDPDGCTEDSAAEEGGDFAAAGRGGGGCATAAEGQVDRRELVASFLEDPLFDVGFTSGAGPAALGEATEAAAALEARMFRGRLTLGGTLKYRVLLEVGGRSCAASLAWAFSSQSVVALAHPPTHEGPVLFGMEPWKHYLPFRHDLSDLRENVAWCFANDRDCRVIAEAARQHVARFFLPWHEKYVQGAVLRRLAEQGRHC